MGAPHLERLNDHLFALQTRLEVRGVQASFETPDLALIEKEEAGDLQKAAKLWLGKYSSEMVKELFDRMMRFIGQEGPHPNTVCKRWYVLAHVHCPDLVMGMSKTDLAKMMDERKASVSWRVKQIFSRQAGVFAPGSRGSETCAANAAAVRRRHAKRRAKLKKDAHQNQSKAGQKNGKSREALHGKAARVRDLERSRKEGQKINGHQKHQSITSAKNEGVPKGRV